MVKGISRQVIVVQSPEPKLFEQAIFILKENMGEGITDEALLKEARKVIQGSGTERKKRHFYLYGAFWGSVGACIMGLIWVTTLLL